MNSRFEAIARRMADHVADTDAETRADLIQADADLKAEMLANITAGTTRATEAAREAALKDVRALAETADKISRKARNAAFDGLKSLERLARATQEPAALTGASFLSAPKWAHPEEPDLEVEGWTPLSP